MKKRIAVIGGGVAGITSAYLLDAEYDVTIFEAGSTLGGHTNTVVLDDGPDAGVGVDTGFIVLNNKNYPLFHRLLERLEAPVRWSNMSFAFYDHQRSFYYAGRGLNGLFSQRSNLFKPGFYTFISEILRFAKDGRNALNNNTLTGETLSEFLREGRYSQRFVKDYLLPMGAAIWSTPEKRIMDFPAEPFLRFFWNHGLLSLKDRPRWQTVVGGSHQYVKRFQEIFAGRVICNAAVARVERSEELCRVFSSDGEETFDAVVFAAHADQTLSMLAEPSPDEHRLLSPWRYEANDTVLHTDASLLPGPQRAWASWNYTSFNGPVFNERVSSAIEKVASSAALTYWMNLLQGLRTTRQYFVSLNSTELIREDAIIKQIHYTHPQYTTAAMATQKELSSLNGKQNSYFCGSYFGYGFHEDAVRSGVAVAREFGIAL